jgi:hypothetical protein
LSLLQEPAAAAQDFPAVAAEDFLAAALAVAAEERFRFYRDK